MNNQTHLTDDQFSELLFGTASAPVREHLAGCAECAAEASGVSGAVSDFSQQSKLWAERRAATHPALHTTPRHPRAWAVRTSGLALASLALIVTAGTSIARHHSTAPATSQQAAQTSTALPLSAATLKADNDLLSAIDGELRVDDSTSTSIRTEHAKSSKRSISE